jgi:O-antigen ligase
MPFFHIHGLVVSLATLMSGGTLIYPISFNVKAFLSCFWAINANLAIYAYIRFLFGLALFWLIGNFSLDRLKIYYAFWVSLFVQSILGIGQFLMQRSFANKYLGIAEHNASELGVSVVETVAGQRWLRVYGGQDHPNIFGAYLVVAIILLLLTFIHNKNKQRKHLVFLMLFVFIFSINLFFTFSRSAWLSLISVIIFLLLLNFIKRNYKYLKRIFIFSSLIFIIFSALSLTYSNLVLTRFGADTRLEEKSTQERLDSISMSRSIIANNFFGGVGINNYALAVRDDLVPDEEAWFYQPVHNLYLLVIAEIGIFGGAVFVFWLVNLFWKLLQQKSFSYNFSALILLILILGIFDHWLWSLHSGVILFWFILSLGNRVEDY